MPAGPPETSQKRRLCRRRTLPQVSPRSGSRNRKSRTPRSYTMCGSSCQSCQPCPIVFRMMPLVFQMMPLVFQMMPLVFQIAHLWMFRSSGRCIRRTASTGRWSPALDSEMPALLSTPFWYSQRRPPSPCPTPSRNISRHLGGGGASGSQPALPSSRHLKARYTQDLASQRASPTGSDRGGRFPCLFRIPSQAKFVSCHKRDDSQAVRSGSLFIRP